MQTFYVYVFALYICNLLAVPILTLSSNNVFCVCWFSRLVSCCLNCSIFSKFESIYHAFSQPLLSREVLMQVDHVFLLDWPNCIFSMYACFNILSFEYVEKSCQYLMMCIFMCISIIVLPSSRQAAKLLLDSNSPNMYLQKFVWMDYVLSGFKFF